MQSKTSKSQKSNWKFEDYIFSLTEKLEQSIRQEEAEKREKLEAVYASDPVEYIKSLSFKPFSWQEKVLSSSSKRVILNCSRQSGKSTIISALPCHTAKYKPGSLAIIIASTEDQAREDKDKVLAFIASDPSYPEIIRNSDKGLKFSNDSRIIIVPATEKSARGYSCPDLVIIDEASRVEDFVYTSGVKPMFTDNPNGRLILLSTPHGQLGFFYKIWTRNDKLWLRIKVRSPWTPVSGPEGLTLERYMNREAFIAQEAPKDIYADFSPRHESFEEQSENLTDMGKLQYLQEYCCEFVETEDSVFTYEEINRLFNSTAPELEKTEVRDVAPAANIEFGEFFK